MRRTPRALPTLVACLIGAGDPWARGDERQDFFEAKIRPVLVGTCFRCHGGQKTSGSLRVDSAAALIKGGETGPAVVPGKPAASLLIRAIERREEVSAMPPGKSKALRPDQVADFATWVQAGAVWPETSAKFKTANHWAFEPIRDPEPPVVHDKSWVKTSVDAFILARREANGLGGAPAADKLALIRRATFDLAGLPPTPEAVDAFLQDDSPRAFETVVDRLLGSPAYGEHWGRHWLDVVRYADTAGETADYPAPLAWRYRNYVIDSFNHDKPYDEFIREQVAGDLIAEQGPPERYPERVAATGYLAISRRFGFDTENYHHLTIQDAIDTLGQSVLGLTLGCARCHDHKFDAVSTRDYYALYGVFDSTRFAFPGSEQKQKSRAMLPMSPPSESRPRWREYEARVAALTAKLAGFKRPVPAVVLRSLHDIDGDFELQAPAAGGSNGVLVPPWLYEGRIAVTAAAQSPYKNFYYTGKVGASVAADVGEYWIKQAIPPRRTSENTKLVYVNLDFRVSDVRAGATGGHCFSLGAVGVLIGPKMISLRIGDAVEDLAEVKPNQWVNLQLVLDLKGRTVSGGIGAPGSAVEFSRKPIPVGASLDVVEFRSIGGAGSKRPALEFDNLGIQETPIAPVTTGPPIAAGDEPDVGALKDLLRKLGGVDGDFELQTNDRAPTFPWNPGPNSVVTLSAAAQSPFRNVYPAGELGIHMPNRAGYDGFGASLADLKLDQKSRVVVGFDFRCANRAAGGEGSWRYYLGRGPGLSAAVELFFNSRAFFQRDGDAVKSVGPIVIGEWYQVQVALDVKLKTYTGVLASGLGKTEFAGRLAAGWDGTLDYTFIDSFGHVGGARPALDADNFVVGDQASPALDAPPAGITEGSRERRARIAEIRHRLTALERDADETERELSKLLAEGPFAMTYGVVEGTPHDARIQVRGEPDRPGEVVRRGFIKALGGGPLPPEAAGSGRLELALWLTRPDNPLTARVMANRVWHYHFGRGIVKTPNDFGVRGTAPTHPELLDHLATQFIRRGWSVKALHRLIMLSATYRQSSDSRAAAAAGPGIDATDLYVSFRRRRLSAEEIRDSILAVSGELDRTVAQEHPFPSPLDWGYTQHGPFLAVYDHDKRGLYLMTQRLKRHPFLALFDGADPNTTTPDRMTTTVPTQALFFLNDPFVHAKAEKWAVRLMKAGTDESARIDQAWRGAFGRVPTESERAEAKDFLAAYRGGLEAISDGDVELHSLAAYLRVILGCNEFLYVD